MKQREAFLDQLRAAATCAVVMLHTVTGVMDHTDMGLYPVEKKVFLIVLDLVCWCVPVFLLISGYLFLNQDRKLGMRRMITKYGRRIVLALFVFGVPYACLEQIVKERCFRWDMPGKAFWMVLRGESWSHLWYLYLILILYLLTPLLKKILTYLPRSVLYGLLAVLFIGSSILPYVIRVTGQETIPSLPDWGIYGFYYICGFLFFNGFHRSALSGAGISEDRGRAASWREAVSSDAGIPADGRADGSGKVQSPCFLPENFGRRKALGRICGIAAGLLAAGMVWSRLSGTYHVQMAYNYPFTAVLALLLFAWAGSGITVPRKEKKVSSVLRRAADLSFTVYLVHPVFLNTAYKFFLITPLSFPLAVSLPVFFSGTLLLSIVTAWVLCQIPLLRKYVL